MTVKDEEAARVRKQNSPALKSGRGIRVEKAITINRPAAEVYAFWRRLENLPLFLKHLHSVSTKDAAHSHWIIKADHEFTLEWDWSR